MWKQHLARKYCFHPLLLGLQLFVSFRTNNTISLIRSHISAILNNFVFIAPWSSCSLSHFLLSVILCYALCCCCCCFYFASEFLILSCQEPNLDLKIYPISKWLHGNENTYHEHDQFYNIFCQTPSTNRRSVEKNSLCSPWFVITLATWQTPRPGRLFISLEQPRMRQNEGILCYCKTVFTPPRWRRLHFSDFIVMWPHTHYSTIALSYKW